MARYKHIDTRPRFLAVDLQRQLLPGTLEHALNYLLDHEIDLSGFDARFCKDVTGAAAYPPAMLLKVVLFAYAQGLVSSRAIERQAAKLEASAHIPVFRRFPPCLTVARDEFQQTVRQQLVCKAWKQDRPDWRRLERSELTFRHLLDDALAGN